MATQKKKHLIELMIEAGVKWPEGAEYAAQDKRLNKVNFYKDGKPNPNASSSVWTINDHCKWLGSRAGIILPSLCSNWHQTIVTRDQYAYAVAYAAAAETVIDWSAAPDWADRVVNGPVGGNMFFANDHTVKGVTSGNTFCTQKHIDADWEIVERRPITVENQPATTEQNPCESATTDTIEQRIAELQAMEKQVAEFRAKLTDDLHALGLTWLDGAICDDIPCREQPVITDWRDLRVGDVIWVGPHNKPGGAEQGEYEVRAIDANDEDQPIGVTYNGMEYWPYFTSRQWRFIRRP